jgi:hypothetical protein
MLVTEVPAPLRERLGPDGTNGLVGTLERTREESVTAAVAACTDRFDRRLVETSAGLRLEMAGMRQEMHAGFAVLRQEMRDGDAALRQEIRDVDAALRQEIRDVDAALTQEIREIKVALGEQVRDGDTALRQEMHEGFARLRAEIAGRYTDLLKWSFLFWVGQVAVVAGLVGVLLRANL